MTLEWRLRRVMADRGVWSGAELGRLLEDKAGFKLSAPSISGLLTSEPKQVKTSTMDALCTALECTPSELWKHTPSYIGKVNKSHNIEETKVVNGSEPDKRLPPI
ncbi:MULTISPECIES: helix-turn-helix domain-containing protein [Bacillus cereus group]|uniref:XRE family transcriptional regulator n=1 Tax=Bacillus thuringiensis TaxID=1428 RepID=A0A9X7FX23_BACTU|nr:helix-turn-helix transcriptional regulator [Bacillus thuringiensis]MCQ6334973.1 helix-turn-helix transcriptional regulator [Bacillus cereus]PFT49184.1 XRE family transcriptional regulator [Bacillus thuringiensis]